jgi:tetratricopeptide (TPR) repeat protein
VRLAIVLAAALVSVPALAQNKGDHDLAVALFNHSNEAYKKGDFKGAAADLEKAYALEPAPVLLYNLGRAYEGLGDTKNAIDAYERYVKAQPDAEDRGAIDSRLTTLRHQLELETRASAPPPPPPPEVHPVSPPPPRGLGAAPIIVTGIGVAGVAVGGVFGALALSTASSQNAPSTSQVDAVSAHDRASTFATVSTVSFIAGGVVTLAGIVWIIVDRATAKKTTAASMPFVVRF